MWPVEVAAANFTLIMIIIIVIIIIHSRKISLENTGLFRQTLTLTRFEADYRWTVCSSQCRIQPCTITDVVKWSFSSQQLCCSLWGTNWMYRRFCLIFIWLFFISTLWNIVIAPEKSGYKIAVICDFSGAFEYLSQISTVVFRGIKRGMDGMVIYDITFSKLSVSSKLFCGIICMSMVRMLRHSNRPYAARGLFSDIQNSDPFILSSVFQSEVSTNCIQLFHF